MPDKHSTPPSPDYGIDAPGVRRGMAAAGIGGAVFVAATLAVSAQTSGLASAAAKGMAAVAAAMCLYGFGMAAYMTYGSRIGKRRSREHLLDRAQSLMNWTGRERVLDIGCGRGLMVVGAARRLTTGTAVGIDLWRSEDQTANTPDAALENARREGVADRVRIETGDARALPFSDGSFDLVVSHWVVHNLPDAADRKKALDEMLRVLRADGVLVLADIAHHADYKAYLTAHGLTDIEEETSGAASGIIGLLSGGTFRPKALIGRRV